MINQFGKIKDKYYSLLTLWGTSRTKLYILVMIWCACIWTI